MQQASGEVVDAGARGGVDGADRNDGAGQLVGLGYGLDGGVGAHLVNDTAWFGNPAVRRGDAAPLVNFLNDNGLPTNKNAYRNPAGRDVVLVSHDTPFVQSFEPDRVLLMPDGALDVWSEDYLDLVALD